MHDVIDRREWLKQTAMAMAGLGLTRFEIPEQNKSVKRAIVLSNNENAYGPSLAARKAMLAAYAQSNRYPDDAIADLQKSIAAHWNLAPSNILLGAGSSEIIGLACAFAAKTKGHIIAADPSYEEWLPQATAFGLELKRNHLPQTGFPPLEQLYGPITPDTRMIYICNPNNPTGMAVDWETLSAFAQKAAASTLVLIDEAYAEYAKLDSLAALAVTHPNIIVAKTFSKIYGLAGARIGYAIAHADTIAALTNYQPWIAANCSTVSVAATMASLQDTAFAADCYAKNTAAKEYCYAALKQLGFDYIPSAANFILFDISRVKDSFPALLKSKNLQVKYRDAYGGKWCRVTMGTMEEMELFVAALKASAKSK